MKKHKAQISGQAAMSVAVPGGNPVQGHRPGEAAWQWVRQVSASARSASAVTAPGGRSFGLSVPSIGNMIKQRRAAPVSGREQAGRFMLISLAFALLLFIAEIMNALPAADAWGTRLLKMTIIGLLTVAAVIFLDVMNMEKGRLMRMTMRAALPGSSPRETMAYKDYEYLLTADLHMIEEGEKMRGTARKKLRCAAAVFAAGAVLMLYCAHLSGVM